MGLLARIFSPSAVKAAEGEPRPGPWAVDAGWIPASWGKNWNFWQSGHNPIPVGTPSAMVEACVSRYSQTVAMCAGDHWRAKDNGGRERVTNSALSRILRKPNSYQSMSDFMLNLTRFLFLDGNAYALAVRNSRFEITELHLMHSRHCQVRIATTGEIFYQLAGNEIAERIFGEALVAVPQRDVLHIRLHTPRHPLRGETPVAAAAIDIAASGAMTNQQYQFYANQARPSTVLQTDTILTKEQVEQIRDRWNEQSQGLNQGGTPILTAGLKPIPLASSAKDSELAEMLKLTEQHIALVFGVPLQVLGLGNTTYGSTEALMQSWIATGLGFAINHIEEAFGQLFGLKGMPEEYLEFDTSALLRSALKDRIESLARGVQGGIYAPNEARAQLELPAAKFGDEPRVQQQVVPLSFGANPPPAPAPVAPAPAPAPSNEGNNNDGTDPADAATSKDFAQLILAAAKRHEERID